MHCGALRAAPQQRGMAALFQFPLISLMRKLVLYQDTVASDTAARSALLQNYAVKCCVGAGQRWAETVKLC